jgi:hypothetical protein
MVDEQNEVCQIIDQDNPFVNIMGGPRRLLIEEMDELAKVSYLNKSSS